MCADFCLNTPCCQAFRISKESICEMSDITGVSQTSDDSESLLEVYVDVSNTPPSGLIDPAIYLYRRMST